MYNPVETFREEADDLLGEIESVALSLSSEVPPETINQLFRAFHTIKGSGAMFGFEEVASFTHHVETTLDGVRAGRVSITAELSELILLAKDHIKLLLAAEPADLSSYADRGAELIRRIQTLDQLDHIAPQGSARPVDTAPSALQSQDQSSTEKLWGITFEPARTWLANGGNPLPLFRDLAKLGMCQIVAHLEDITSLEDMEVDSCYLSWTITLRTMSDEDAIRDVFIFVEDDSRIEIKILEEEVRKTEVKAPLEMVPQSRQTPELVSSTKAPARESMVRVPADRLDRLVGLVGELVMNQSRLASAASRFDSPELTAPVEEIERLIAELRDDVLGIRMMQIGTLFGRFRRLVHDLSSELKKEVDLITKGEETELDKSILDQLAEPLVHLLRNSIDHGVETSERRLAAGKSRRGRISLAALHTGSGVVVTVEDDGRGLDRTAIRNRAVERGLISPDANLSDKEIFNLILLPGFSTAQTITSVSGRGVGMDVVKRQIEALRGSLVISSEVGQGTKISLTLPLTLAIIEGLLVEVAGREFIVPMTAVLENVELYRADRTRGNGRNLIAVRGELIPYIDLRQLFELGGESPVVEKVVIVNQGDQRVGLVVDRVLGTHQTVIQSLGKFFRNIEVVSGATIMGDGRVALIMDVAASIEFANRRSMRNSLSALQESPSIAS